MASGVLTAGLRALSGGRGKDGFDEQLLTLFRNRAALKKEFNELRNRHDGLKEKLRNAEAATRRAEERLEAIERLMAKPEAGYNGLVYFQLRTIWRAANDQLKGFAAELQRQQEDRERQKIIQAARTDRDRRLEDLSELIRKVKAEADRLTESVEETRGALAKATGLFAIFRRRELSRTLEDQEHAHRTIRKRIEELFDRRIKIEGEPWPEFPGLSIEGRRAINIAIIAYAYLLCAHFKDYDLANRAREAVTMPIQDLKYGNESDCTMLIRRIQDLLRGLADQRVNAGGVKGLAAEIRRHAKYRNELETVPVASSLANLHASPAAAKIPKTDVLREEYWDVYDVFVR
jgi:hypothetical protein